MNSILFFTILLACHPWGAVGKDRCGHVCALKETSGFLGNETQNSCFLCSSVVPWVMLHWTLEVELGANVMIWKSQCAANEHSFIKSGVGERLISEAAFFLICFWPTSLPLAMVLSKCMVICMPLWLCKMTIKIS